MSKSTVYVIDCIGTNYFKIGVTTRNVMERLVELQTGSPHELSIRCTFETENPYQLEQFLHQTLQPFRVRGEWFEINIKPSLDDISTLDINNSYYVKQTTLYDECIRLYDILLANIKITKEMCTTEYNFSQPKWTKCYRILRDNNIIRDSSTLLIRDKEHVKSILEAVIYTL